jgi:tRNA-dihydrouridine synthase B
MKEHTQCAGIMVARGSHGNPWIFREIKAALHNTSPPRHQNIKDKYDILNDHILFSLEFRENEMITMRHIKKHLCWYTAGIRNGKKIREALGNIHSLSLAHEKLKTFFEKTLCESNQ